MFLRSLLATTALVVAAPAWAGDIKPVVNVSTELANDLRGLTFAADGKIYTSGHVGVKPEETRTIVARFNPDGTPDATFAGSGIVDLDLAPGRQEQSLTLAALSGGDVVVAVSAVDEDEGQSIYLLRFDSNGVQKKAPDWGDDQGRVEVVLGWANAENEQFPGVEKPPLDTAWDLLVDNTGGKESLLLFAMGSAAKGTGRTDIDRYVIRLNPADGAPDASFNGGKPFTYHSTGTFADNARRGMIEPDGAIMFAGYTNFDARGTHVVLLRLTPDGKLDPSFGNFIYPAESGTAVGLAPQPGVAVLNPFTADGGFAECYTVGRLSNGRYVTTGYGGATGENVPSTLGYLTTKGPDLVSLGISGNALDPAWGNNGVLVVQSEDQGKPSVEERSRKLIVLPDDRTVHFGRYGGTAAIYVVTPDGKLDATVDGDGILELGDDTIGAQFFNGVLSPDGKRIAVTTSADPKGARLVVFEIQS